MGTTALQIWQTERAERLDRLQEARATLQQVARREESDELLRHLDQARVVWLAAEFQGFCRDLHDECIESFLLALGSTAHWRQSAIRRLLTRGRRLDRGNATWGNVCKDFDRFPVRLAPVLQTSCPEEYMEWVSDLEELHRVRNLIVHAGDNELTGLGQGASVTLQKLSSWRVQLNRLSSKMGLIIDAHSW